MTKQDSEKNKTYSNNHPKGKSKISMKQAKEEIDRASAFEKLFPPRGFTIKRQALIKRKKKSD